MTFSRHTVQHQQGEVVWRVGRKWRASPDAPTALHDEAGLRALLVAGQRRTADVSSSRTGAVGTAGHRDQTRPCGRGPGGGVLTVRAGGWDWGQSVMFVNIQLITDQVALPVLNGFISNSVITFSLKINHLINIKHDMIRLHGRPFFWSEGDSWEM